MQEGYWYLSRHGIGPGTIPNDCTVLETKDHETNRWKCYIKLDRILTPEEIEEYELREQELWNRHREMRLE